MTTPPPMALRRAGSFADTALGRALVFAYGLLAYGGFLAAFLYAVGFVHDVFVPTSLDRGAAPAASTTQALLVDTALLLVFAIQHNVMARPAFKRRWTRVVHPAVERSSFVLATVGALALLFSQWRALPAVVWELDAAPVAWALHALAAAGWLTVLVATFEIDHFALFGLRQTWTHARGAPPRASGFALRGTYRWVRHPLMLGFLVAFWSTPRMTVGHLLFAAVVTVWVLFTLKVLEERDLLAEHGESYRDYMRAVPALLPWPRPRG